MKERPILFKGPMVIAIDENRKTQTRRIVKPQPKMADHTPANWSRVEQIGPHFHIMADTPYPAMFTVHCPYGKPSDQLWVREMFQPIWATEEPGDWKTGAGYKISYPATDGIREWCDETQGDGEMTNKCKPSIHMPRWASRITLEIVSVRVERLQDISEADAKAEGVEPWIPCGSRTGTRNRTSGGMVEATHREAFEHLWKSINGPDSWSANPYVWAIEFQKITP